MRVGIIDVGSNTARLLVARAGPSSVTAVHAARALLALGDEIEQFGRISDLKLAETAHCVRGYARKARELGARSIDLIVTAPGRQSENAQELLAVLERASGIPPRVITAEEEGRLAFEGAVGQARSLPNRIAVCDVGGGSTEVVVGTRSGGPRIVRSLEIGSLRLSRRFLAHDPPGREMIARARAEVEARSAGLAGPPVDAALATGGAARALRRVAGRTLGESELDAALEALGRKTVAELGLEYDLDPVRARTLLGGALILAEARRRLGVPLQVARGGLREGAAAALLADAAAA